VKGAGVVAARSLREQLLALPGVAEAEVDGDDTAPAGVRIRLAPEAQAEMVGREVQRVLTTWGVRSRLGGEAAAAVPPLFEPAAEKEAAPPPAAASPGGRLQSVILEEGPAGVQVTVVGSDGRRATGRGEASEEGLESAIIAAVGRLAEGEEPRVLSVEWVEVDGSRVVTVVLEGAGGRRGAGAAVVRASRSYAVGRAAWTALTD
jgi:hypothetical protein